VEKIYIMMSPSLAIVQILIVFLVPTIVTAIFETEKPGSSRKK
jgi:hypothetical protein